MGWNLKRLRCDLLHYAACDTALVLEDIDLRALVDEVVAHRTGHLTSEQTSPTVVVGPLPSVHGDRVRITQVLNNLIGNALKFTLPGQPAHIEVSAEPTADGWTRVQIADRGIGIPTADQPHVFTSFHRAAAHANGTGLGFAICHRVVDRHGGTITADRQPRRRHAHPLHPAHHRLRPPGRRRSPSTTVLSCR